MRSSKPHRLSMGSLLAASGGVGLAAALALLVACRGGSSEQQLDPQSDLERSLADDERHGYALELRQDEYLHLVVNEQGVDVALQLSAPDGQLLAEVDSPPLPGAEPKETLELVASESGQYRLEVFTVPDSSPGVYRIRIAAWRPAISRDRDRAAAMQAFAQGHNFRRQRNHEGFKNAIERYRSAAQHWQAAGEPLQQASALNWRGDMHRELSEPREAVRWIRQSLELFRGSGGSSEQITSILNGLGRLYRELREESSALASYQEALELARQLQDRQKEALYLNNIALTYKQFDRTGRALHFYEEAVARRRAIGDPGELATIEINFGTFCNQLGRFERARVLLENALRVSRESGNHHHEARALSRLGAVLRRSGQPNRALESLEKALALQDAERDLPGRAMTLTQLGRTHLALEDSAAAKEHFERSLEIYLRHQSRTNEAQVRSDLGWLFIELGDPGQALVHIEPALRRFRVIGSRSGEASALHAAARAERLRGDLEAARQRIERAIEIVESLRSQSEIMAIRTSYLARKQDYYELYIDILVELHLQDPTSGFDKLAFAASERRRARSLRDELLATQMAPARNPDPQLVDQERELQHAIDTKDREFARLRREEARPDAVGQSERELEELLMARERLQTQNRAGGTQVSRQPPLLTTKQAQAQLDPETLLLEITLGKHRSFLWLVTPTSFELVVLPRRAIIEKHARTAYRLMASNQGRRTKAQLEMVTNELSRLLLEPVAPQLSKQRLLLVSDAALQYVPFAALPIPHGHPARSSSDPEPELMVTAHEIVQVPSLSVLALLRRQATTRPPPPGVLAVVADPVFDFDDRRPAGITPSPAAVGAGGLPPLGRLPGTKVEAEAILQLVPETKRFAAQGFEASREAVLNGVLAGYRYVHFATHSVFIPERPEASGLALSRYDRLDQPIEASILRDHEIFGLDLPAELVVLSACRTGLGREIRGEGLVGLTQGFLNAGTPRVLVSFWQVDDRRTAELMVQFYRGILEHGLKPADALRQAQLSMLAEPPWQAPYYWAGFFLQGEWR